MEDLGLTGHAAPLHHGSPIRTPSRNGHHGNIARQTPPSPDLYNANRYAEPAAGREAWNDTASSSEFVKAVARFPSTTRGTDSSGNRHDAVLQVKKIAVTKSSEGLNASRTSAWSQDQHRGRSRLEDDQDSGYDDYDEDDDDNDRRFDDIASGSRSSGSASDEYYSEDPESFDARVQYRQRDSYSHSSSSGGDATASDSLKNTSQYNRHPSPSRVSSGGDTRSSPARPGRAAAAQYRAFAKRMLPSSPAGSAPSDYSDSKEFGVDLIVGGGSGSSDRARRFVGGRVGSPKDRVRVSRPLTAYASSRKAGSSGSRDLDVTGSPVQHGHEAGYRNAFTAEPGSRVDRQTQRQRATPSSVSPGSRQRPVTAHASASARKTPSTQGRPVTAARERQRKQAAANPSGGLVVTGATGIKTKNEYLSELRRLAARLRALESDQATFFRSRVLEAEVHSLADLASRLDHEREKMIGDLASKVTRARSSVRRVRDTVSQVGTGSGTGVAAKLGKHVNAAENAISAFRDHARHHYDVLDADANGLDSALTAFAAKVEQWEEREQQGHHQHQHGRPSTAPTHRATGRGKGKGDELSKRERNLPPEVIAVDRLLAEEGGHTGGWDHEDHALFVKLYQRFYSARRADDFARRCVNEIPNIHTADVFAHLDWYARYNKLIRLKKAAVNKWRASKAKARGGDPLDGDEMEFDDYDDEDFLRDGRSADRAKARAEARQRAAEREAAAAKIAKWKAEKQREAKEEWELKQEAARQKEEKKQREQRERQETRQRVAMFKQQRQAQARAERAAEEAARKSGRRPPSARELAHRREQDAMLVAKRQAALAVRRREREITERRLKRLADTVKPKVAADRSRLRQATEATLQHHEDEKNPAPVRYGGQVGPPSRLAVPSWRKGM